MTSRGGINRPRLRQQPPLADQLTPLGRAPTSAMSITSVGGSSTSSGTIPSSTTPSSTTPITTTVVQNSGNVRARRNNMNNNIDLDSNSLVDIVIVDSPANASIITFDAEQFRSEVKANGHNGKRIEQLILNAINYFIATSRRTQQQQIADYTVLAFLGWTVALHSEVFTNAPVCKAMCTLLKGSTLTKAMRAFPNTPNNGSIGTSTPYSLVCQILWLAYKDQTVWPDDFVEAYVEDALGEQNWIKNPDCQPFISNILTAFDTRPRTWKLHQPKITTSVIPSLTIIDETSNDTTSANDSIPVSSSTIISSESDASLQIVDDSLTNDDRPSTLPRYEGRSQAIQTLLQSLLTIAKAKASGSSSNTNSSTVNANNTSQPHETDKLLSLLEHACGLPEIRLSILSRLDIWLQNPKLNRTAERLMITLCENLTNQTTTNSNTLTNGYTSNDSHIDERAIEQLLNLRFKVRSANVTNKMYILCIREMLITDVNLVDIVVRLIVHNELQQQLSSTTLVINKNPNNLALLQAACQAQPDNTCQALAYTIQNILLLTNVITSSKDYDNLLKLIRPFLRDFMRYAKNDFDSMRFCMHLLDMHYSNGLQQQFWNMIQQQQDASSSIGGLTSQRLVKRLLECDMATRERFLYAICDIIPMIILASAQAFLSITTTTTTATTATVRLLTSTTNNIGANDQWLIFIQRIAFIQCCACQFFLYILPRLFDASSSINPTNYVTCLYSMLFTVQKITPYLRIENWPPEEPTGLRNELFRLASEVPLLGETLYLLVQIGLTSQLRLNPTTIVDLIEVVIRRTFMVEQKMSIDIVSSFQTYLRLPESMCLSFITKFFDLSRYVYPSQIQFPLTYRPPNNLAVSENYWKCCLNCLLLAVHDPHIFGRLVWSSMPQIRLLMEMLLTGDYNYPPKSWLQLFPLEKCLMDERVALRNEKDTILELEQYLAAPTTIDEINSQLLDKVTTLDLQLIKRPSISEKSPQYVRTFYERIQGMNNTLKMSSMLCRCRSPDFILDILNRKKHQTSSTFYDTQTSWLTGLIDSNIDCLHVFPVICLCDYLQHMILMYNNKFLISNPSKKTLNALETILTRFKSIIRSVKQHQQQQQIISTSETSIIELSSSNDSTGPPQTDDLTSVLNYFFNCLNSKVSTMRSNAWLCLHIILDESDRALTIEQLLEHTPIPNIENILTSICQLKYVRTTPSLLSFMKQTLAQTCHLEMNVDILHHCILFVIDYCQITSNLDNELLCNLARALLRRHSVLFSLLILDRQNQIKHYRLTTKFFEHMARMIVNQIQQSLNVPIEIMDEKKKNNSDDETISSNIQSFVTLPNFNDEQLKIVRELEKLITNNDDCSSLSSSIQRHYIEIDPILVELLLVFLAYFDSNTSLANLLQQFFLNPTCSLCFTTLKQIHRQIPIKQTQEQTSAVDESEANHFKQFAIEDDDQLNPNRKRRLSHSTSTEKVFVAASTQPIYQVIATNDATEQSLFHSDDVQYFLFKSTNSILVQRCLEQASLSNCLKLIKTAVVPRENINFICRRLNDLLDGSSEQSTKQIQILIKQSPFILPLLNGWILEQMPDAIQLGEKLSKLLEKKKKIPSTTRQKSHLLPTTSRSLFSIGHQMRTFDRRINDLCHDSSSIELNVENKMDTSDLSSSSSLNIITPWKDVNECEELLKRLVDKKFDRIKRRQFLVELQWIVHQSEEYRLQLVQALLQRCRSADVKKFVNNLNEQSNCSLVLLAIALKKSLAFNPTTDDRVKLIDMLKFYETQGKSAFGMKIKALKRATDEPASLVSNRRISSDDQTTISSTNDMLNILCDYYPVRDYRIETNFDKYLKANNKNNSSEECKRILMNVLVEAEDRLSESTIGMLLDQLETMDNVSIRSPNTSIYANRILFSQRTRSSISQRLLLKQFLHSCDWSIILECIYDLLTLHPNGQSIVPQTPLVPTPSPVSFRSSIGTNDLSQPHRLSPTQALIQSRCSLLEGRDSVLILDMLQAFLKLSPLWSGRESKMLERCHDEPLIDLTEQHLYVLLIYILDEAYRRLLSKESIREQYTNRYESLLCYLINNRTKKDHFRSCLHRILIDYQLSSWTRDLLAPLFFTIYIHEPNLFDEQFYLILPKLFDEIKQQRLETNNSHFDHTIHDLLVRLNSFDLTENQTNIYEVNLLLKQLASTHPYLFLRHLPMITSCLQSRVSTLTMDEYQRRDSRQRFFFLSIFDLIDRLQPYIFDRIYVEQFQSILETFIRLLLPHLSALNTCTIQSLSSSIYISDLIYLIDGLLTVICAYLNLTNNINNHRDLFKMYTVRFFDKIRDRIQQNQELFNILSNGNNGILRHLAQLKILNEAANTSEIIDSTRISSEIVPFDVRLCLVDRSMPDIIPPQQTSTSSVTLSRPNLIDVQHFLVKLSSPIHEYTTSTNIDDILLTLTELKSTIERYVSIELIENFVEPFIGLLNNGNKQIGEAIYDLIFKYIEKFPGHAVRFYAGYMQCLQSSQPIVFQLAIDHFAHLIIYFRSNANQLFDVLFKQGLMNKIDVTSTITQAIRLLTLGRYDPIALGGQVSTGTITD